MLGSLQLKMPFKGRLIRVDTLNRAESLLTHYISTLEKLRILRKADYEVWKRLESSEEEITHALSREQKIENFRHQQATERRQKMITEELKNLSARLEEVNDYELAYNQNIEVQELKRESQILYLQTCGTEALDELRSIVREREMLNHMALHESESDKASMDSRQKSKTVVNGSGLEVTHISSFNGSLQMKKEIIKSNVFQPTVALPTMSLEEYADKEMQAAIERQEREKNAPQPDKRYSQLVEAGEEDDIDLLDKATFRDREWDDWKDEHPRGYGNKANKRF